MSRGKEHKTGKIKSLDPTALPPLPRTWRWATLDDLAASEPRSITDGPFGSNLKTSHYTETGPRVIRLQNIGDGFFLDEYAHISESHFESLKRHEIISGDVAIAALGETLPRSCVFPSWVGPAIVKADCPRFRPNHEVVLSEFVNYALNSPDTRRRTSRIIHGVGRPRLNLAEVRGIWLPVAPLNEQRRIVSKIEELFSDLDAGVAALDRAKANLKRYRAAILKAAVEGKLTEAWRAKHPSTEPASQLLERILAKRRQKWEADQLAKFAAAKKEPPKNWKEKYVEPSLPDTAGLPDLPPGWCWASVGQLGDVQLGRQRSPKNRSDEFPTKYVRAANLTEAGLDLSDVLDMEFQPRELETYRLYLGDVLLSEASGSPDQVGKPVVWNGEIKNCCFQNTVIRLRPVGMPSEYPLTVFRHYYRSKLFAKVAAGVGINHLSAGKFSALPFPLAPLAEQERIIAEVEERLSVIAAAEKQITTELLRASSLRQSILKQAFVGKLVSQNADDEPATALLARMQEKSTPEVRQDSTESLAPQKLPRDVFLRRASVVSYTVRKLSAQRSFGRTQLEKTLHLTQCHLGVDLGFQFERYAAGPFDKDIYKLEGVARKNNWFSTQDRARYGVTYHPGPKIESMCQYAPAHLGTKKADFDRLLDHIAAMTTDQAELLATAYAAWNDLLIDGRPADDDAIIAEVHGWHKEKLKFKPPVIRERLKWMRQNGYIPTGQGQRTIVVAKKTKLKTRRKRK